LRRRSRTSGYITWLTSRDRYATAGRIASASCSVSRIRLRASRSSADSLDVGAAASPSAMSACCHPVVHRRLGNAEVLRDLGPRDLSFPGRCDHVAAKLFGMGLGHDVHLSSQDQILAGPVVNQALGPVCPLSAPQTTPPAQVVPMSEAVHIFNNGNRRSVREDSGCVRPAGVRQKREGSGCGATTSALGRRAAGRAG